MVLFFDLPKDLIVHILHDWVSLCCTCRLDSASVSTETRPTLLSILKDPLFIYKHDQIGTMSDKRIIHWIWTRRVGIESLVIPSESKEWKLDFDLLTAYLTERGKSLLYLSKVPYSQYSYGFFEKIPTYLNSSQLNSVLSFCPNITELLEISTDSVTLLSMSSLRKHCKHLRCLSIVHHRMDSWDPTPLIAFVAGGDCSITQLRVPSVQKYWTKFSTIVKNMTKLTHLRFDRSRDIIRYEPDDSTFVAIARYCKDILMLHLSDTRSVYNSSLFALAQGCAKLTHLYLARCTHITTPAVVVLAEKCVHLSVLDLSHCTFITDDAVIALSTHCTNLTELRLQKLSLLTNNAIHALANCTQLHTLDVSYCTLLTAPCITTLISRGGTFQYIDISACTGLETVCLHRIAVFCPHLRYIGLRNCNWVTDSSVRMLEASCVYLNTSVDIVGGVGGVNGSSGSIGSGCSSGSGSSGSFGSGSIGHRASGGSGDSVSSHSGSSLYSGSGSGVYRGIAVTGCMNITAETLAYLSEEGALCYE